MDWMSMSIMFISGTFPVVVNQLGWQKYNDEMIFDLER